MKTFINGNVVGWTEAKLNEKYFFLKENESKLKEDL